MKKKLLLHENLHKSPSRNMFSPKDTKHLGKRGVPNGLLVGRPETRQVRTIVRSIMQYGRYVDEIAVNNSEEYTGNRSGQDTWHNLEATATSRAINRAISDLIGAGEVPAEEIVWDA
jgi:hypothetical protein